MPDTELVTLTEYARRRGCTEGAVRRAARDGRITLVAGRVDPAKADEDWQRNTRVRAGSTSSVVVPPSPGKRSTYDDSGGISYDEARRRREAAEAELAELKLAEEQRRLVDKEAVKGAHARAASGFRDALLQLAARLAPLLVGETDQAKIMKMLNDEHRHALQQFAEGADGLA